MRKLGRVSSVVFLRSNSIINFCYAGQARSTIIPGSEYTEIFEVVISSTVLLGAVRGFLGEISSLGIKEVSGKVSLVN